MKINFIKSYLSKSINLRVFAIKLVGTDIVRYLVTDGILVVVQDDVTWVEGLDIISSRDILLDMDKGSLSNIDGSELANDLDIIRVIKAIVMCLGSGVQVKGDVTDITDVKEDTNKNEYIIYKLSNGINYVFNKKYVGYFKTNRTELNFGNGFNGVALVENNLLLGFIMGILGKGSSFSGKHTYLLEGYEYINKLTHNDIRLFGEHIFSGGKSKC